MAALRSALYSTKSGEMPWASFSALHHQEKCSKESLNKCVNLLNPFPQGLKAPFLGLFNGTAKAVLLPAVSFQNRDFFRAFLKVFSEIL
jgi:hypothetical protein